MKQRRFIIRKYVMASSASEAIKKEHDQPVEEVYVDEKQPEQDSSTHAIGFTYQSPEEE